MIKEKIKDRKALRDITAKLKEKKKKVVFTNGCFDILHAGHVGYLEGAKRLGDILIVAVNSDDSARRIKGKERPFVSQQDRMKILASLESVDFVTVFDEDNPASIVEELKPDVIVKGSDWKEDEIIGREYVRKMGGKVVTMPYLKDYSTTALIKRIKGVR